VNFDGKSLRAARQRRGMSLERLAEISGISERTIRSAELGQRTPRGFTLRVLAESLGARVEDFLRAPACGSAVGETRPSPHQPAQAAALWQLPDPPACFVGREREIQSLRRALEVSPRICIVSGMAGVGKTALALAAADRSRSLYPDGQIFLDLHGASDPYPASRVMQHVLWSIFPDVAPPEEEERLRVAYLSALRDRRLLLLLDNAFGPEQTVELVPPRPNGLLLTSRRDFSLPGGAEVRLAPLPRADACRLISAIAPSSGVEDELAELCGDLPLALTVAADAVKHPDCEAREWAASLDQERSRLRRLERASPHIGVEASLRASLGMLDLLHRDFFYVLSIFPQEFDRDAACSVLDTTPEHAAELLREFISIHVLQHMGGRGPDAVYKIHDLVRILARQELKASAAYEARIRHARHYSGLVERSNAIGADLQQDQTAIQFTLELRRNSENLRTALEFCEQHASSDSVAARLYIQFYSCPVLTRVIPQHLFLHGCVRAIAQAEKLEDSDALARLRMALAMQQPQAGGPAIPPEAAAGFVDHEVYALAVEGTALVARYELLRGLEQLEDARELAQTRGLALQARAIESRIAQAKLALGRADEARSLLGALVEALEQAGEAAKQAIGQEQVTALLCHYGVSLLEDGSLDEAEAYGRSVVSRTREAGTPPLQVFHAHLLSGLVAERKSQPAAARAHLSEALRAAADDPSGLLRARAQLGIARLHVQERQTAPALALATEVGAYIDSSDLASRNARLQLELGYLLESLGDLRAALHRLGVASRIYAANRHADSDEIRLHMAHVAQRLEAQQRPREG